jgi:hypothetical protein
MRAVDKRLDKLRGAIVAAPVLPYVLDEAYEWFTCFGELPEERSEDHVTLAVIRRAMNGGKDRRPPSDQHEFAAQLRDALHDPTGDRPTVRPALFEETLHENAYVRQTARSAITVEVAHGGRVESAGFAGRHGLPTFGTVGMHVLGYPRKWIAPPYEFQGERLLTRYDDLRSRTDQRNPKWFEPIADALLAFHTKGALPSDELVLGLVIADAELDAHRANKRGQDVAEQMALFSRIARAEGEERDEAWRLPGS